MTDEEVWPSLCWSVAPSNDFNQGHLGGLLGLCSPQVPGSLVFPDLSFPFLGKPKLLPFMSLSRAQVFWIPKDSM